MREVAALFAFLAFIGPSCGADIALAVPQAEGKSAVITLNGQITPGDVDRLRSIVQKNAINHAIVYLESPGGRVGEAIALGRYINNERTMETAVANYVICTSACALVWLSGAKRHMEKASRIGFHTAHDPETKGRSEQGNELVRRYLIAFGYPREAFAYITSANPGP